MKKKSLEIKENKYGLRVNCSECDRVFSNKNINICKHGKITQSYKSIVYKMGGGTNVKHFETANYDEALILAIQFKKDVKNGVFEKRNDIIKVIKPEEISVIEAANMFLNFKYGNNVPLHLKQNLSSKYLDSLKYYIQQFLDILTKRNYNIHNLPVAELDEVHVGKWTEEIRNRYSEGSWDAPLRVLRLWINYVKDRQKVVMFNPFNDVKLNHIENNVTAISKKEFEGLCEAVKIASPFESLNGTTTKRKNRYRPYLLNAFRLALHTGLRREEFLSLTWNDIYKINDSNEFMIITDNIKVERITGEKYKKKYIPIHEDLEDLLNELGWNVFAGSDKYIIEPNRTSKVITMMSVCTKAFTHYFKQAYPDRANMTLKVLRKTYLSYLSRVVGDDIIHFSSHSGVKVLEDHYFDQKLVAKGIKMKIFS